MSNRHIREVSSPLAFDQAAPGGDDFTQAVDLLRRVLKQADHRHDPQFVADVKKCLDILRGWLPENRKHMGESLSRDARQVRLQEIKTGSPTETADEARTARSGSALFGKDNDLRDQRNN